jgi:hypothetical protein
MTQDEIIEMARQAGFEEQFTRPQDAIVRKGIALSGEFKGYKVNNAALEAFAKLVDAKATEREREACAKVCKSLESNDADWDSHHWNQAVQRCEYAIRSRGEA